MRAMIAAAVFVGVCLVAPSAIAGEPQLAQQPAAPRVPAPLFPALPPTAPVPPVPAPLFSAPPQFTVPQFLLPTAPLATTRVVCGMTVIEGDAKIDPKMVMNGPAGPGQPKPLITVVQPPMCGR